MDILKKVFCSRLCWVLIISLGFFGESYGASLKCSYNFDLKKSKVEVTGFKFTSKTGVTGKFLKFDVSGNKTGSLSQLLSSAIVKANFNDFDSGNVIRTQNIMETLLLNLSGFKGAEAKVSSLTNSEIQYVLKNNGTEKTYTWPWKLKGEEGAKTFNVKGEVDLIDFIPQKNFKSFAKRREGLHRGPDGVAKTWSVLDVAINAAILKECK